MPVDQRKRSGERWVLDSEMDVEKTGVFDRKLWGSYGTRSTDEWDEPWGEIDLSFEKLKNWRGTIHQCNFTKWHIGAEKGQESGVSRHPAPPD